MAEILTMEEKLFAYLASVAGRPFWWGHDDCARFAADWADIVEPSGAAFATHELGYDEEAFGLLLLETDGFRRVVDSILKPRGWRMVDGEPQLGDIGIVETAGGDMLGIHNGRGWVVRLKNGLSRLREARATIWRLA